MKPFQSFVLLLLLSSAVVAAQTDKASPQRTKIAKSSVPAAPKPIPPFDKLELFAFLAAGPFPPYAAEVIHQRGLDFVPNDPFLLSYPFDPVREALAHVTPVKPKPLPPKRAQAFAQFSEVAGAIRDQQCTLAEQNLQAAIRLAPDSASLHFAAASCRMIAHDWPAVEKEMRESLRLWPGNADAHALLAYVLINQGRDPDAIPEAREAVRIFPKHQGAIMVLGVTLARNGQYAEAIPILRQSAGLNQKVTYVEKFLGFSLLSTNQPAEAIDPLNLYIQAVPEDAEAHFLLGKAFRAVHRDEEAQAELDAAARLEPQNQRYQSAAHPPIIP
jgi:predicted Zn-dependent protease